VSIATESDWTIGTETPMGVLIENMAIRWSKRFEKLTGTTLVPERGETPSCPPYSNEQIIAL
jgi:hypothetical protein